MSKEEPETTPDDGEMMNMFASVWVKVEVETCDPDMEEEREPDPGPSPVPNPQILISPQKPTKQPKQLKCTVCDYTTIYRNCLKIHTDSHLNVEPHACKFCTYTTKYVSSLRRHVNIKHSNVTDDPKNDKPAEMLFCDQCDYKTQFLWNLKGHKRKHTAEKKFKCAQCPYETAYRNNYTKHCKVHKDYKAFQCDKCPFVTKYEGHIHRHLAQIHNEITDKAYLCDLCDFSTQVKWRLNIHKQRSKQLDILKCSYCEFETFYNCESKKHKTTHYSEMYGSSRDVNSIQLPADLSAMIVASEISKEDLNSKTLPADINAMIASQISKEDVNSKTLINDIISQHFEENEADVNKDSDSVSISTQSDKHSVSNNYTLDQNCVEWNTIQVLESDDNDRPFQCHMCSYTSKFKASVQRHFQRHHTGSQNRPYKCVNCDFSTKTKDQIALHNKRSVSETILLCPACNFTTFFKCQHIMHQKSHNPFKCTSCSYSCKQKMDLTKHYATMHLGSGLKCQYCDYRSVRKESILCHETIHTGIKPYKCGFCDYMSVRKSLLNNHMKRYHSDVKKDVTVVSESKIESLKIPVGAEDELIDICEGQSSEDVNVLDYSRKEM